MSECPVVSLRQDIFLVFPALNAVVGWSGLEPGAFSGMKAAILNTVVPLCSTKEVMNAGYWCVYMPQTRSVFKKNSANLTGDKPDQNREVTHTIKKSYLLFSISPTSAFGINIFKSQYPWIKSRSILVQQKHL